MPLAKELLESMLKGNYLNVHCCTALIGDHKCCKIGNWNPDHDFPKPLQRLSYEQFMAPHQTVGLGVSVDPNCTQQDLTDTFNKKCDGEIPSVPIAICD